LDAAALGKSEDGERGSPVVRLYSPGGSVDGDGGGIADYIALAAASERGAAVADRGPCGEPAALCARVVPVYG
jgi:hypothetical protein